MSYESQQQTWLAVKVIGMGLLLVVVVILGSAGMAIYNQVTAPKCPVCGVAYNPEKARELPVSQRDERYHDALEEIVQEGYTAEETRVFIRAVLKEWEK